MAVSELTGPPDELVNSPYELLDAAALIVLGELLWGSYWKRQMAAELGVSEITINRWSIKGQAIPVAQWRTLLKIASRRQQRIGEAVAQLIEAIPSDNRKER